MSVRAHAAIVIPNIDIERFSMNLADFLVAKGVSQTAFADRIGVSQPSLSRYISGATVPNVLVAERIKAASGGLVTFEDWTELASPRITGAANG